MTDIDISTPVLLELSDRLREARDLVHAMEMAIAGLDDDGEDSNALHRLIILIDDKIQAVAEKLDGLRTTAKNKQAA